jgi:hypothetical protein
MRRMRTQTFLVIYLLGTSLAYSKGMPALLRCSSNDGLDIYVRPEPSSPIIARLKCGDRLVLLEQESGPPHVRTQDGKEGFILSHNLGQWWIQPEGTEPATSKATNTSNSPTTPSGGKHIIRVTAVTHDSNSHEHINLPDAGYGTNKLRRHGNYNRSCHEQQRKLQHNVYSTATAQHHHLSVRCRR